MTTERGREKLVDRIGTFTTIPNTFIKAAKDMSHTCFRLFITLRFFTNTESELAFPSYATIKALTGMSNTTIAKAVRELVGSGWMTRSKRYGASSLYILNASPLKTGGLLESTVLQILEDQSSKNQSNSPPNFRGKQDEINKTSLNKTKREGALASLALTPDAPKIVVPDALKNQKPPTRTPGKRGQAAKRRSRYDPDPSSRTHQVKLYRRAYPTVKLTRDNTRLIADTFTDLEAWSEVLGLWKWGTRLWSQMLDRYESIIANRNKALKAKTTTMTTGAQAQQFGEGGEWYRAALAAGFDLGERQEVNGGN